jgi:hypothetical protein
MPRRRDAPPGAYDYLYRPSRTLLAALDRAHAEHGHGFGRHLIRTTRCPRGAIRRVLRGNVDGGPVFRAAILAAAKYVGLRPTQALVAWRRDDCDEPTTVGLAR